MRSVCFFAWMDDDDADEADEADPPPKKEAVPFCFFAESVLSDIDQLKLSPPFCFRPAAAAFGGARFVFVF